jgi:hypothetical protein
MTPSKLLLNLITLIVSRLKNYGGQLDFTRFNLVCYICKEKTGSCIECDLHTCRRPFHVRCAVKHDLIVDHSMMDESMRLGDWECKVYCQTHRKKGKTQVRRLKSKRTGSVSKRKKDSKEMAKTQKAFVFSSDEEDNSPKRSGLRSSSYAASQPNIVHQRKSLVS